MEQWRIQKDRERCDKPGCPLPGEREYYAILQLPDCVRLERCQNCFHELRKTRDAAELPFHWKIRRTLDGRTRPMLDLASLRLLFDKLGEEMPPAATDSDQPTATNNAAGLRYLVALLLLRKRKLKMVDPTDAEQERADLVVVDPRIEDMQPVVLFAPELDEDRLANLRDELMVAIGDDSERPASAETRSLDT